MSDQIYQLVLQQGPRPGEVFSLTQPSMIIGRDPMSDIVLNDPEISRNHARLTLGEDGYAVQDMGSTNGTFVNGKRLRGEPSLLVPGSTIILGSNVILVYHVGGLDGENEVLATMLSPTDALPDAKSGKPAASSTVVKVDPYAPTSMSDLEEEEDMGDEYDYIEEPSFEDFSTFGRPAPASPAAADYRRSTPIPETMSEPPREAGGNTRTYMMIGAGVGLLLCCCLLGVVAVVVYFADQNSLINTTTSANDLFWQTAVAFLGDYLTV